uniref:Uncharacterized protein n=1 Tax=Pristionchus pacificus TaxID=54126 RepID=A0A2A6CEQ7_PRIPA|eukprot:PDM76568.1 hypothetical protein PRIPAC_42934 [Pristionchus pacificus]
MRHKASEFQHQLLVCSPTDRGTEMLSLEEKTRCGKGGVKWEKDGWKDGSSDWHHNTNREIGKGRNLAEKIREYL